MTTTKRTLEQQVELVRKALADVGIDPQRVNMRGGDLGVYYCEQDGPEEHFLIWKAFRLADPEGSQECYDCWAASGFGVEITCPAHSALTPQ